MNTTLYYFTGTGNSLHVARTLAERLGNTELVPLIRLRQQAETVVETERVGLVFPLYFAGVPEIVENFVKTLNFEQAHYIFAVVTRGGGPSYAFSRLEQLLHAKSRRLNLGRYIQLPSNYILASYYKYTCPQGEKRQALFEKADADLNRFAQEIAEQRNEHQENNPVMNSIARLMRLWFSFRLGDIRLQDKSFVLDETCNSCGICQKVCPVQNIVLNEGKPQWQHQCQQCMACIQFCPKEAIQYGTQTSRKPRYHNPNITVNDLIKESA